MSHDELRNELAAYSVHLLDDPEAAAVEAHLAICPECRAELAEHCETAARLAESFPQVEPPVGLKLQIMSQIRPERAAANPWLAMLLAAAVVMVLLLAGQILTTTANQQQVTAQLEDSRRDTARLREELSRTQSQLAILQSATRIIALEGEKPGQVRLVVTSEGKGMLLADLPPDAQNLYQVWLISGKTPVSMGVIRPIQGQLSELSIGAPLHDYQLVALTLEKSEVAQPTSKPLWVGKI